ncbi:MAG TPA: tetratricopeptide repeat protein, partial [Thermoanaerobaculia bacterium]|nr:tetratricopeptide repeat protein [Thermoanaerobaculia bacterium]
ISPRLARRTLHRLSDYIDRHPGGWRKRLEYARGLRERGDLAAAVAEYEQVLSRQARHVAAWLELAETASALHGASAAATVYERALRFADGDAVELLAALAEDASGSVPEALVRLEALGTSSSASYIGALAARSAIRAGLFDRAAAALEPALRADPANGVLLTLRHDALALAGRDEEALAALHAAVAGDPLSPRALQRLFLRLPAPARGSVSLRRLLEIGRGTVDTQYVQGVQAWMRGMPSRALAVAETLVRERPRCALAWLRNAELHRLCLGAPAVDVLRFAAALDLSDPRPRILLANALAARGQEEEAAQLLRAATELGPLGPIAVVRLAERGEWSSAAVTAAAAAVAGANPSMAAAALLPGRLPC